MERPQIAYEGDDHQVRKVAANTQNKQSRTADKRWYSSFGVCCETVNPSTYNLAYNTTKTLEVGRSLGHDLSNGWMGRSF
jgi:hypothetical protein